MGLLDILNGMQNGPRGAPQPAPTRQGEISAGQGGGMSPWMMALLGMLAYKAIKGGGLGNILGGSSGQQRMPASPGGSADLGDMLGGLLGGGTASGGGAASGGLGNVLGGLLGGGAAGSVLNGGLRNLLQDMEDNGQGEAAKSWVGTGENRSIGPNDLARAIGADDIAAVARETGMSQNELLSQLSQHLPDFVDQLTPNGRMPTDQEASRW
jgi:uncharacterized protein YidB (DUF937 family)